MTPDQTSLQEKPLPQGWPGWAGRTTWRGPGVLPPPSWASCGQPWRFGRSGFVSQEGTSTILPETSTEPSLGAERASTFPLVAGGGGHGEAEFSSGLRI